jgi:hypothetical protein
MIILNEKYHIPVEISFTVKEFVKRFSDNGIGDLLFLSMLLSVNCFSGELRL